MNLTDVPTSDLEIMYKAEERRIMEKLMTMQEFSDELALMHLKHLRVIYNELQRRMELEG